jgi:hypothetical protein
MVHTAVWERPVEGPRLVRRLDIDGGGPVVRQHAVCGQDINDVREWHVPGGQLPDWPAHRPMDGRKNPQAALRQGQRAR